MFLSMLWLLISGGIGVGVGAVQINCISEDQFISEAGEATVYSSVAKRDDYSVVRRYAHFNEGTMVVFDIIVSGGYCFWGDYFVKDFASEGVIFSGVKTVWE